LDSAYQPFFPFVPLSETKHLCTSIPPGTENINNIKFILF